MRPLKTDDDKLTPEEAARFLGVPEKILTYWRNHRVGGPPYLRLSQKVTRYLRRDLRAYLATCRVNTESAK